MYTILLEATRSLAHIGVHILHITLSAYQVFDAVAGEKFSVDIDNNALDITLDQFFFYLIHLFILFYFLFFLFYPFYIRACYLVSTVCLWFQEVNLHAYEDRVKAN